MNIKKWWRLPVETEKFGRITVVRDDLLEGGTKLRFLPFLIKDAKEVVFATTFCGGAQMALSVCGREFDKKITLFTAKRNQPTARQQRVMANGAKFKHVPMGFINTCIARAKKYAAKTPGALYLPQGFDVPESFMPFLDVIKRVRDTHGTPDEVWCAVGSGMLVQALGLGFPDARVIGVGVGLKRARASGIMHNWPKNIEIIESPLPFQAVEKGTAPFDSDGNYDRKAWVKCAAANSIGRKNVIFWNVLGAD